jgi:hypothetical protein
MNYFKEEVLLKNYEPPALYLLTIAETKTDNPIHDEVIGCTAYPLYLKEGQRGCICYLEDDKRFHRLHTSTVKNFTPWGNGEDTIIIETKNTKYILMKL